LLAAILRRAIHPESVAEQRSALHLAGLEASA